MKLVILTLLFVSIIQAETTTYQCGKQTNSITCSFTSETGLFSVTGTGEMKDYVNLEFEWNNIKESIKNIEIGEGVTSIGNNCFNGAKSVTEITFPSTLKTIGVKSFRLCFQMETLTIPSSIETIKDNAFEQCGVKTITFQGVKTIGKNVFDKSSLETINLPNTLESVDMYAIKSLDNLTQIVVADGGQKYISLEGCLVEIKKNDNSEEDKILRVYPLKSSSKTLPSGITIVGKEALKDMPITEIQLPSTVKKIEEASFQGTLIERIDMNEGLKVVEQFAFADCPNLKKAKIPTTLEGITYGLFERSYLLDEYIGDPQKGIFTVLDGIIYTYNNVVVIGCPINKEFTDGKYTTPSSLVQIYDEVFKGLRKLKHVELGESVTTLQSYAFADCINLETVTIKSKSLNAISENAFKGCVSLKTVTIGNGVDYIGYGMFDGCSTLHTIVLGNNIKYIDSRAFQGTALKKLTIPDSCQYLKYSVCENCKELEELTIGKKVRLINENSFYNTPKLKKVTIAEGSELERIDINAFKSSGVETISLPSTVLYIDEGAFESCVNLKTLTYQGSEHPLFCTSNSFTSTNVDTIKLPQQYPQQEFCGIRLDKPILVPENPVTPNPPSDKNNSSENKNDNGCSFISIIYLVIVLFTLF